MTADFWSQQSSVDSDEAPSVINSQPNEEESYWTALLVQGEYAPDVQSDSYGGDSWWDGPSSTSSDYRVIEDTAVSSQKDWRMAEDHFDNDQTVELNVTGCNRGGLLVSWNSLRGFVPASQLVDFPIDVNDAARRSLLSRYISKSLNLRVIEIDAPTNRLIFSERAAQALPGQRAQVLSVLTEGQSCQGTVTNLCDFGAFVDLGGVEGLIHISELSWGRVNHPRDVLKSGQEVQVHIMSIDADDERIALSLKRLQPDPWATVEQRYQIDQEVDGIITNVVDFGAFACIEEGLEGLIHISELAEGQFLHPRNVVQEGDRITARILNIDGKSRRLGLTLRQKSADE